MYSEEFKKLVKKGVEERFYIGTGNPDAKILIVGKEVATEGTEDIEIANKASYDNNAGFWDKNIKNFMILFFMERYYQI